MFFQAINIFQEPTQLSPLIPVRPDGEVRKNPIYLADLMQPGSFYKQQSHALTVRVRKLNFSFSTIPC